MDALLANTTGSPGTPTLFGDHYIAVDAFVALCLEREVSMMYEGRARGALRIGSHPHGIHGREDIGHSTVSKNHESSQLGKACSFEVATALTYLSKARCDAFRAAVAFDHAQERQRDARHRRKRSRG